MESVYFWIEEARAYAINRLSLKGYDKYENLILKIPVIRTVRGYVAGKWRKDVYYGHQVKLNEKLHEFGRDAFQQTLLHEFAHAINHEMGYRRHDTNWRFIMRHIFNIPDEVTHKLALKSVRKSNSYVYECSACHVKFKFSKIRHRKVLNGAVYRANCCTKSVLTFTGQEMEN